MLHYKKCIFEDCTREAKMFNISCRNHWCKDGHLTTLPKYKGYCECCFISITQNRERYLNIMNY